MAKRDTHHNAVKTALIKDGWTVTDDPLHVPYGGVGFLVDLGADRLLGAERGTERIAVEIKSFIGASDISEFYVSLGQFLTYRHVLGQKQPERVLYVAVPDEAWLDFFSLQVVQEVRAQHMMRFIVFDPVKEVIVKWTSS